MLQWNANGMLPKLAAFETVAAGGRRVYSRNQTPAKEQNPVEFTQYRVVCCDRRIQAEEMGVDLIIYVRMSLLSTQLLERPTRCRH